MAQFKRECEQRYAAIRQQVLNALISGEWLIDEGEARGLTATPTAVRRWFEMSWKDAFKSKADLERYLASTGETIADQLFRATIKVFSTQLEKQYGLKNLSGKRLPAFLKLIAALPKKWAAKTDCRAGYIVANCRQYKGPLAPAIQLL